LDNNTDQVNNYNYIFISTMALFSVILALLVLFLGEDILKALDHIYPDWSFPVFFIPWFLLIISTLQKLNKNKNLSTDKYRLQVWILKTTIPLFIFTTPFFSQLLSVSATSTICTDDCLPSNVVLFGFEPYCTFIAIVSLFLINIVPSKYLHNK
jgi:hypothetical protein